MADAAVQEAIYALQYRTGDSVQQLQAARTAAMGAAAAADKLAESEVNVSKATLQVLAALDPRIRAEQRAAQQLEKISTLYRDGRATADQYSMAVGRIQENYLKVSAANDNAITSVNRFGGALGAARNLLGAFGIALSAAAVVGFAKDVIKTTADLDDQADVLGLTTDALQAYRLAAIEAGSSTQFIQTALERYVRSVGQARDGNKPLIEAFQELGITADDLAGDPGASLPKVVREIMELENVTDRAAKLTVIFGRGGQQMEQVLKSWATPLDEQIARFKELGLVISREQIEAFDKAQARFELFFQRLSVLTVNAIDMLGRLGSFSMPGSPVAQGMGGKGDIFGSSANSGINIPMGVSPFAAIQDSINVTGARADPLGLSDQNKKIAEEWATEMDRLRKEQLELHKGFWSDVREVENNSYERSVKEAENYWKDVDKKRDADEKELDDFHTRAEQAWEKHYERIFKEADDYWKDVDKLREESGRDYERQLEQEREKVKRYWEGVALDLTGAGKSFWMEFAETGRLNFKDLFADLKATFARVLFEMIVEARLKPIILRIIGNVPGLGGAAAGVGGVAATGGGAIGTWLSGGAGTWGGAAAGGLMGLGIGGITGMIGGNSTGGMIGGGIGGAIGSFLGPIGTIVGGALGGLLGGLFKGGKASDMRSVATFGADGAYTVGAQSAHEVSQQTLGAAAQASQAIMAEVAALKSFGVEFKQQLENIWIGERDASTYQMVGGQRVGVGSVGDPTDLAVDVLTALLKGATSNDPKIQAILSGGGSSQAIASALNALQQAKDFTDAIEQAILGIKDPLEAALALWKKESDARLAAATALGTNIDQVKELNALLYKQIVTQQNAGALSSIGGLIDQLEYGPGSAAAPKTQYASALKDYEAAKKAAMGGGAAEAQTYAQVASSFLPFAREYLGTSQAYGAIETGALNTLKGLQTSLSAAPGMPSLQPVVTQVAVSGAMTVEAVKEMLAEMREVRAELRTANAMSNSLMSKIAA